MSKHTPGPWQNQEGFNTVFTTTNPETGTGLTIAIAKVLSNQVDSGHDEATANALLIAVSPELYALAERIARLNKDAGEIGAGMLASLVDEATRIIAKVEQ